MCRVIGLFIAVALLAGCATFKSIVTPARVESVTALGAYIGAKAAIVKGHRVEIEQALEGLKALQASGSADMVAIINAIDSAGVPIADTIEGELISKSGVLILADFWAGTVDVALNDELARAALRGVVRGFSLAVSSKSETRSDIVLAMLKAEAKSTRPK